MRIICHSLWWENLTWYIQYDIYPIDRLECQMTWSFLFTFIWSFLFEKFKVWKPTGLVFFVYTVSYLHSDFIQMHGGLLILETIWWQDYMTHTFLTYYLIWSCRFSFYIIMVMITLYQLLVLLEQIYCVHEAFSSSCICLWIFKDPRLWLVLHGQMLVTTYDAWPNPCCTFIWNYSCMLLEDSLTCYVIHFYDHLLDKHFYYIDCIICTLPITLSCLCPKHFFKVEPSWSYHLKW